MMTMTGACRALQPAQRAALACMHTPDRTVRCSGAACRGTTAAACAHTLPLRTCPVLTHRASVPVRPGAARHSRGTPAHACVRTHACIHVRDSHTRVRSVQRNHGPCGWLEVPLDARMRPMCLRTQNKPYRTSCQPRTGIGHSAPARRGFAAAGAACYRCNATAGVQVAVEAGQLQAGGMEGAEPFLGRDAGLVWRKRACMESPCWHTAPS